MEPAIAALLLVAASAPAQGVEKANPIERIIRFEYRVVNCAASGQDVDLFLALPRSNERQEVLLLRQQPGTGEVLLDSYGNQVLHFLEKAMGPGEVRTHGWMAAVRCEAAVWPPAGGADPLSAEEKARYTRDSGNYQIASPEVAAARDSVVRPGMSERDKARALFDWLIRSVAYLRDGRWEPAPVVLRNGKGSCSEFNYALIALLRSCGIPCRYTGGCILTADNRSAYDPRIHEDAVFHRWTEIHLDGGWIPADASRGAGALKRFDNVLNHWGRLPAGSLQTYRGDGGEGSLIGWEYVGMARARGEGSLRTVPVCYWIDAPRDRLEPSFGKVEKAIAAGLKREELAAILADSLEREVLFFLEGRPEAKSFPVLIEGLLEARHPSAAYEAALAERLGIGLPAPLKVDSIAGETLRSALGRRAGKEPKDRGDFEHWWRKARPLVTFDPAKGVFDIPRTALE